MHCWKLLVPLALLTVSTSSFQDSGSQARGLKRKRLRSRKAHPYKIPAIRKNDPSSKEDITKIELFGADLNVWEEFFTLQESMSMSMSL
jgi:hypothetical protein